MTQEEDEKKTMRNVLPLFLLSVLPWEEEVQLSSPEREDNKFFVSGTFSSGFLGVDPA